MKQEKLAPTNFKVGLELEYVGLPRVLTVYGTRQKKIDELNYKKDVGHKRTAEILPTLTKVTHPAHLPSRLFPPLFPFLEFKDLDVHFYMDNPNVNEDAVST